MARKSDPEHGARPAGRQLAIQALERPVPVLESMSKLTATLESQHHEADDKPELDEAIRRFLTSKGVTVAEPESLMGALRCTPQGAGGGAT